MLTICLHYICANEGECLLFSVSLFFMPPLVHRHEEEIYRCEEEITEKKSLSEELRKRRLLLTTIKELVPVSFMKQ